MNPSHSDRIPSVHCSLSILCPKNFYPMGGRLSHRISRGAHAPRGNFQPRREQLVLLTFRWAILRCTLLASCSAGLHGSKFPLTTVRTSITHPYTEFPFSFFSLDLYKCLWTCLILSRSINIYSIKYPAKKFRSLLKVCSHSQVQIKATEVEENNQEKECQRERKTQLLRKPKHSCEKLCDPEATSPSCNYYSNQGELG